MHFTVTVNITTLLLTLFQDGGVGKTQWLKCRPDGTIVAKLKYRPDGISLKKSVVPARRHCSCEVVVPSRP